MVSFSLAIVGFAALAAANPLDKRACIADNCRRALTVMDSLGGTARPVIASSDCSTFMQPTTTITVPAAVPTVYQTQTAVASATITSFTTGTETSTATVFTTTSVYQEPPVNDRRNVAVIPAYASACSGSVRYSSACSCIGIFASPTVTVTATLSVSSSITDIITVTSTTTLLQISAATTITLAAATSVVTDYYSYTPKWDDANCGYSYQHIVDYQLSTDSIDTAIDTCAGTCTDDSTCKLFTMYEIGGVFRCATFDSFFDAGYLQCPDPGWTFGYNSGYEKDF